MQAALRERDRYGVGRHLDFAAGDEVVGLQGDALLRLGVDDQNAADQRAIRRDFHSDLGADNGADISAWVLDDLLESRPFGESVGELHVLHVGHLDDVDAKALALDPRA